eukprot:CAMPEP_0172528052 /NCGR_PEP_ID=MMETSP1067-20121228/2567_1 /TAXON_ID=265564 ORGANISM="Thalassiosira punctigera, Strain Tpunct2005C2" /NCGR_SAMPLE_ID=MMETSP1067 /ASSEMBLY_ACC=CAM_ASM_000444 /LENGTH=401 /DNA_ID=CAMNT_0013311907 /DNA_START=91 /DNA_END=1296 /DNA_ORIENTATION=-
MATMAATFRAKTNFMKSWRPRNPPSNRDRLELYALHKQSVSGDAPAQDAPPGAPSADRAKLCAWRGKRGMGREDAMAAYMDECERQLRVYGTRGDDGRRQQQQRAGAASTSETASATTRGGETSASSRGSAPNSTTPQNTPANEGRTIRNVDGGGGGGRGNAVLLCPRGLAAIPLLCAAASESRSAYLARLQVTNPNDGWWAKQEPLCLEIDNPLSIPEKLIIALASQVEQISLVVSNYMGDGQTVSIMSPRVLQAFLWPIHNVLLCCWIVLILTTTCLGSMATMCRTLLFGAKRTNAPLGRLFAEEVLPSARATESLCEDHQVIGIRVAGLALMPLMMLCDFATSVAGRAGMLVGSLFFLGMGVCSWWYWVCVLPWLAVCGLCLAVMSGWCFGLIELAGN